MSESPWASPDCPALSDPTCPGSVPSSSRRASLSSLSRFRRLAMRKTSKFLFDSKAAQHLFEGRRQALEVAFWRDKDQIQNGIIAALYGHKPIPFPLTLQR